MKFRHLGIFKCLCEEMNMTKTAKKLFVSQPSVSQAIAELEEYYNCRLFERLSHSLYLTESGEMLRKYAEHIIAINSELEEVMLSLGDVQKLKVGATVTIGTYKLAQLIEGFTNNHVGVEIISSINNTKEIEDKILNSSIDLALVEGSIDSNEIIVKPYMEDELVVICNKNHKLSTKESITIEDLSGESFLIREEGSGSRRMFVEKLKNRNLGINIVGEFTNNEAIKNGVKCGLGMGVVSRSSIDEFDDFIELEVSDMKMIRNFSVVYHKNKYLNKGILDFIDYILK